MKAWDCDPWSTRDYFIEALSSSSPNPLKNGRTVVKGFDPGSHSVSHQWVSDSVELMMPAFGYIRLFEQVGIPLRLPRVNIGGPLERACRIINSSIGYWSPAILVRSGQTKKLKEVDFMSRTGVAAMDSEVASRLHQWGAEALTRVIHSIRWGKGVDISTESLLEVLPEFLSRLAFRVGSDELEKSFNLALDFHRSPGIRSHSKLHEASSPWFKRIFNAAADRQLLHWLPRLIRSPFFDEGVESAVPDEHAWPDPMRHLPTERVLLAARADSDLLVEIRDATGWLLKRARSESGESRRRILSRLTDVYHAKLMNDEEQLDLGTILWEDVATDDLPDLSFPIFNYLHLPRPLGVDIISRIRKRILDLSPLKRVSIEEGKIRLSQPGRVEHAIYEMAAVSKPVVQTSDDPEGLIEWNRTEALHLWSTAADWWGNEKSFFQADRAVGLRTGFEQELMLDALKDFDLLLARVVCPHLRSEDVDEWNRVSSLISEAKELGVHLMVCLPYMLLAFPERSSEIELEIEEGLAASSETTVETSACAVRHWFQLAGNGRVGYPSDVLLKDLVKRVAFRRPEGIHVCIRQVSLLLVRNSEVFTGSIVQTIMDSLPAWDEAVRLPLQEEKAHIGFPEDERADLRASIGMLVSALWSWLRNGDRQIQEPACISLWRASCESDPLPEVRRSIEAWVDLETEP
ncbi:MAG: hypothetical protein EOP06_06480 [Proteobacteria bacterium]|nr:MAG: hypothetical protein EOP06_06480 [Pseudomonadota bacterium]